MGFHIVRIEVSKKKESLNVMSLPSGFATVDEAEVKIRALAGSHPRHGENRKEGYWWYEDQGRRYWLIVKDDDE
jgi:hypothetical protein